MHLLEDIPQGLFKLKKDPSKEPRAELEEIDEGTFFAFNELGECVDYSLYLGKTKGGQYYLEYSDEYDTQWQKCINNKELRAYLKEYDRKEREMREDWREKHYQRNSFTS